MEKTKVAVLGSGFIANIHLESYTRFVHDAEVAAIIRGESPRRLLVIGPCSADREDSVLDYVVRLVSRTRAEPRLRLGASPRASLDLRRCAQAAALLAGRDFVTPSDVRSLAVPVLAHRLLAAPRAGATAAEIVESVVRSAPVPD